MNKKDDNFVLEESLKMDDLCEECKNYHESVKTNFIMHSFKLCDSCKISKTIFPI